MSENKARTQKSWGAYGALRTTLILALVGYLLWTLGKSNPKVKAFFDRFVSDQKAVASGTILSVGGESMGTYWNVKTVSAPKEWDGASLREKIAETLDAVDAKMSTYRDDSEISRFNALDSTDWFEVSPETAKVVALALEISRLTDGAFDITVGPLVDLWRFGPNKAPLTDFPTDDKIAETRAVCGWQNLEVKTEPSAALRKSVAALQIDLSAIAKGYAVDAVTETLLDAGIENLMVDIGGEVRCAGAKGDKPWTLGIEKPVVSHDSVPQIHRFVRPNALALATSGGGRNFSVLGKTRFSHIIDPRTGRPTEIGAPDAKNAAAERGSVSVLDRSCAKADALATGLYVLGSAEGKKLADANGWPVLYLDRVNENDEAFPETESEAFKTVDSFLPK